ncbi:hypothetical protein [Gordonia sp. NPDC003376]
MHRLRASRVPALRVPALRIPALPVPALRTPALPVPAVLVPALVVRALLVPALLVPALIVPAVIVPMPVHADADPPPTVTLVLTSDTETGSAVWLDATGARRSQHDLPLTLRDPRSGLWSGSLTYTATSGDPRPAVVFVADGEHAGCAVFVGEKLIVEDSRDGPHATAICL